MNENIIKRNDLLAPNIIKSLKTRNMTGYYAHTKEEALKMALEIIPEGSTGTISLKYQENEKKEKKEYSDELATVSVRYKEPDEDESKLASFPISKECYTKTPNCDTLFAAYVAECGMIINESEYVGKLDMGDVAKQVSKLSLDDEYKEEFLQLIKML